MVFHRGGKRVRNPRRFSRRPTVKSVNRKVNKILAQTEKKFTNITITGVLTATSTVDWLSPVDLNTGNEDRIGQKITGKSLSIRYSFRFATASTHHHELIRVLIVIYREANSGKPAAASILENVTPKSFMSLATADRFRIIYDRTHVLNRLADLAVDSSTSLIVKRINLRDLNMTYNSTAVAESTGVGGEKNQLMLVTITDAGANFANIEFASQLIFTDS